MRRGWTRRCSACRSATRRGRTCRSSPTFARRSWRRSSTSSPSTRISRTTPPRPTGSESARPRWRSSGRLGSEPPLWARGVLRLELGARAFLVRVALLGPGFGVDVVPAHLPETALVLRRELESAEPLRALPRVAPRHDEAQREAVLAGERLAAVGPRDEHVVVQHRLEREVRRVAVVAVRDHPLGLVL